ncbi:uncharacterized protein [Triticum aestivum]|uniref:uncharacterized protein n=1 Tax=Triticum aestivum TaxID=4565 RepID=UPI001D001F78|nr:uncharacterized protein LOC123141138 [Triticum aestivum]
MAGGSSFSSSRSYSHSSGSPALANVKAEPVETPLGWRTRGGALVINKDGRGPSALSSCLVKLKIETGLIAVKKEHNDMAADEETALKWARADYVQLEMERERLALEEIASWRRGCDESGVIVLEDSDEEAPPPTKPVRQGDLGQGCSKDRDGVKNEYDGGGGD